MILFQSACPPNNTQIHCVADVSGAWVLAAERGPQPASLAAPMWVPDRQCGGRAQVRQTAARTAAPECNMRIKLKKVCVRSTGLYPH